MKSFQLFLVLSLLCLPVILDAQNYAVIGNGTGSNSSSGYPAPYGQYYYGARHQFLVTAAELSAAGVTAGSLISSVGFNVIYDNGGTAHNGFQVIVYGTTNANPLSGGYHTAGQLSASAASNYNPFTGWNQHAMPSFTWNGTDNLVIQTCFNNSGWTNNASTQWTTNLSGTSIKSRYIRRDASGVCGNTGTTGTSTTTRPNIRIAWTPSNNCNGMPNAAAASISMSQGCAGYSVSLSASGYTTGNGISYLWQSAPSATGPWSNIGGASNTTYGLSAPATRTYYRLMTTCNYTGLRNYSNVVDFNPSTCCSYTFILTDAYGDGWNGASMDVMSGSTVIASLGGSFSTGSSQTLNVDLADGVAYSLFYVNGGSWASEVGIQVLDAFGNQIYNLGAGAGTVGTQLTNWTGLCSAPPPPAPSAVVVSNPGICAGSGNAVTLTASGASGTVYWYSGSCSSGTLVGTGNSITVSPNSTTTYYAKNFNGTAFSNDCANGSVSVFSAPLLDAGINDTICEGQTLQLNATTSNQNTGSLSTVFAGGNGCGAGNMFDVSTLAHPITINGFTVTPNISSTQNVLVYYRQGGYSGFQSNAGAWTLLGTYSITGTSGIPVFVSTADLSIPSGTTYGIYVQYEAQYTSGANTYSNADISISTGVGNCSAFDGCCSPRTFNGTVHYTIGAAPTISWDNASSLSSASILDPIASPTSATTYTVTANLNGCIATDQVSIDVNTISTPATISGPTSSVCPNTDITLTASGGVSGTGAILRWYDAANGTGTLLGTGNSLNLTTSTDQNIYVRREGLCNATSDAVENINVKNFVYAANNTSTSDYCTDNGGWHHFYTGDEIILSVKGDLSTAGLVTASIQNNGSYHAASGNPSVCANGGSPGEAQFELPSSWNIDHTGSLSGNYEVRFYYDPTDKTNMIAAANAWMNNNPNCAYTHKYNASNNGLFWFKSNGVAYQAPSYDDDPNMIMLSNAVDGTTSDGANYTEFSGINGFSGGSGAIVLSPAGFLPVDWMYFEGEKFTHYNQLRWGTAEEEKALRFEIERSADGMDFEQIGQVNAVGNSFTELHYEFNDLSPMAAENYYRLKLINEDGSHEYSHVIVINNEVIEGFAIFPNPVEEVLYYKFQSNQKEKVELEVIDLLGRVILKSNWDTDPGLNILNVETNDLQSGNYSIRILHKERDLERTMKFTKK